MQWSLHSSVSYKGHPHLPPITTLFKPPLYSQHMANFFSMLIRLIQQVAKTIATHRKHDYNQHSQRSSHTHTHIHIHIHSHTHTHTHTHMQRHNHTSQLFVTDTAEMCATTNNNISGSGNSTWSSISTDDINSSTPDTIIVSVSISTAILSTITPPQ